MDVTCFGFLVFFSCSVPTPAPSDSFCQIYTPIRWSAADTRLTKEQVDTRNRVWKRLCK